MHIDLESVLLILEKIYPEKERMFSPDASSNMILAQVFQEQGIRKVIKTIKDIHEGKLPNIKELMKQGG